MATRPFLDANIILRHILGDHPDHSPRATAYFGQIARGELTVRTTDTVVFEAVYALQRASAASISSRASGNRAAKPSTRPRQLTIMVSADGLAK